MNRAINYSALRLLFSRNPAQFRALIEAEKDYFSTIATYGAPVVCLIHFLSREASLYGPLADHAKAAIQHAAESDISAHCCLAWFTVENLHEHAARLGEWMLGEERPQIDRATWDALLEISDSHEWAKLLVRLASKYYVASVNYDTADRRFSEAIRPLLVSYEIDDCIDLIEGIQGNGQTWERSRAYSDHRDLRARALELDPAFDPTKVRSLQPPSQLSTVLPP